MELKHPFLFLSLFCFLCSTCSAFNITKILDNEGYKEFSGLLSESGLAKKINGRQTITVLAVKDGSIGDLSGKPKDEVARVLSTHVILDYYDVEKLKNLKNKSSLLTTLYQTTGSADNQEGFLNVTKTNNGVMFGSAKKGSDLTASLVGPVHSEPYNISVLQVSGVIGGNGGGGDSPAKSAKSPEGSSAEAPEGDDSPAGADAPEAESPVSADAPVADSPESADAPVADSPVSSPPQPEETADGPVADSPADAPADSASSGLRGGVAAVVAVAAACIVGV